MKPPRQKTRRALLYRNKDGWRWRLSDYFNGKITAASSESFVRRDQAILSLATETGIDLRSRVLMPARYTWFEAVVLVGDRSFLVRERIHG